jgi:phosphate uptake regulator
VDEARVQSLNKAINREVRRLQDDQLRRMTEDPVDPRVTMIVSTILTDYRRVRAHTLNIHEAVVDVPVPVGA